MFNVLKRIFTFKGYEEVQRTDNSTDHAELNDDVQEDSKPSILGSFPVRSKQREKAIIDRRKSGEKQREVVGSRYVAARVTGQY